MTSLSTNCRTVETISVWNSVRPERLGESRHCARPLEHRGQALPAADAHGLQPVAAAAAVQFARQRREHAPAGRADGVSERDAGAVHVRPLEIGRGELPLPHHRERLGRERLVEFDQVDVGELQARLAKCGVGRGHRPDAHDVRRDAGRHPRTPAGTSGVSPSSAAFSGVVTMHIDAASFWPLELPAVTVGSGSCLPAERVSACSTTRPRYPRGGARRCRSRLLALAGGHVDRDDLLGEDSVLLRGHRPLVRGHRQLVLLLAAGFRTRDAGSRRSPACRPAPGSAGRRQWCGRGRGRRESSRRARAPPQRMSVE